MKVLLFALTQGTWAIQCQCDSGKKSIEYFARNDPGHKRDQQFTGQFSDEFLWGASTSSYQVEGAWNEDGKGLSIWDNYTHLHNERPSSIRLRDDNGDITGDAYHKIEEDIEAIKSMGLSHYRFSISWPRIYPDGKNFEPRGLVYYENLIDALLENGIEPMITLFHWDLPQNLQDQYGGFISEEIVTDFTVYAKKIFDTFADRVKFWFTINEPWSYCVAGSDVAYFAPGTFGDAYPCMHNMLKAHAEVYHLYDNEYRIRSPSEEGKIGITIPIRYAEPLNPWDDEDISAADRYLQFEAGWMLHPIHSSSGDYPEIMKDYISRRSNSVSRLPVFSSEDIERIKGTADFMLVWHRHCNPRCWRCGCLNFVYPRQTTTSPGPGEFQV